MVNSVRFPFPGPNPVGHPMPPRWMPDGIPPNGSVVLFPMPTTGFITFPSVGFTLRKFPPQVLGYGPRPMVGSGPVPKLSPIFIGIRTAIGFISSPQDTENPTTTIHPNHSSSIRPHHTHGLRLYKDIQDLKSITLWWNLVLFFLKMLIIVVRCSLHFRICYKYY